MKLILAITTLLFVIQSNATDEIKMQCQGKNRAMVITLKDESVKSPNVWKYAGTVDQYASMEDIREGKAPEGTLTATIEKRET